MHVLFILARHVIISFPPSFKLVITTTQCFSIMYYPKDCNENSPTSCILCKTVNERPRQQSSMVVCCCYPCFKSDHTPRHHFLFQFLSKRMCHGCACTANIGDIEYCTSTNTNSRPMILLLYYCCMLQLKRKTLYKRKPLQSRN